MQCYTFHSVFQCEKQMPSVGIEPAMLASNMGHFETLTLARDPKSTIMTSVIYSR